MLYPPQKLPASITAILATMLAGFVITAITPQFIISTFGLVPSRVLGDLWLWQTITYMALHGGLLHLVFNMFALYMFGSALAYLWGETKFINYFLICGLGAAILSLIIMPESTAATIGASGAIYGLLFAWGKEFPNSIIYIWGLVPIRAKHLVLLLFLLEFALSQTPSSIARFAHLGGLITGFFYFYGPHFWRSLNFALTNPARFKRRRPAGARQEDEAGDQNVDKILEKIVTQGIDHLTPEEKKILDSASKKLKKTKTE